MSFWAALKMDNHENESVFLNFSRKKKSCRVSSNTAEVATKPIFKNSCSFHSGAPFSGIFQKAFCVHWTDAVREYAGK